MSDITTDADRTESEIAEQYRPERSGRVEVEREIVGGTVVVHQLNEGDSLEIKGRAGENITIRVRDGDE